MQCYSYHTEVYNIINILIIVFTNGTADLRWTTHLSICAQMERKNLYRSIYSTSPLTLLVLKRKKKDTKLQMHLQMSPAKNDAKYNIARFAFLLTDSQSCVQPSSNFKEKFVYVYIFWQKAYGKTFHINKTRYPICIIKDIQITQLKIR